MGMIEGERGKETASWWRKEESEEEREGEKRGREKKNCSINMKTFLRDF